MNKSQILIITFFIVFCSSIFSVGIVPVGDGSSTNPYLMENFSNLLWLSENSDLWDNGLYFEQINDIDATESNLLDNCKGFLPIGNGTISFQGHFEGSNYSIMNLFINRPDSDNVGLFGRVNNSYLYNINLIGVSIVGDSQVGGMIGYIDHSSGNVYVENCEIEGEVHGNNHVGGLSGYVRCTISSNINKSTRIINCSTSVNVSGGSYIAGLIGESSAPMSYAIVRIDECSTNGSLQGQSNIGGLVGKNSSYRRRTGNSSSSVTNCFSTCNITGVSNIGGIVGYNSRTYVHNYYYTYYSGASIQNCYSMGNIQGVNYVGGIVGNAQTGITPQNIYCISYCYANGSIYGEENVGGIAGYSQSAIVKCFWNVEKTGQSSSAGISSDYGVSDSELKNQSTFSNEGWSFPSVWSINSVDNMGYPYLTWYSFPEHHAVVIPANNTDITEIYNTDIEIQFNNSNHDEFEIVIREFTEFNSALFDLPENIVSTYGKYWSINVSNFLPTSYTLWINLTSLDDIIDFSKLAVLKRDNYLSSWENVNDLGGSISIIDNKIRIVGLNTFSDFIVASTNEETLPVELSSFTANQTSDYINILWTTESESNLLGYNIYRNNLEDLTGAIRINPTIIDAENNSTTTNYDYFDNEYNAGLNYYWLESCELTNESKFFGPIKITYNDDNTSHQVYNLTLLHNAYPNPFNPETKIDFSVKDNEEAILTIYNIKGQIVKKFQAFHSGEHSVVWNGTDNNHNNVCSGLYFYRLESNSYAEIKKIILMK